ncbi:peptidylprolyl isomerase [Deinococcus radiophilus]|uniref:peptidylprolyl isomerase n=1 Tax=Deinococcus radiophilus TaxID=32062 RepID=A0A431VUG3_9DEIO|nr:peptidylprolyl isomerase [Deinococcus radiophilus]RTR26825.1 peptidylprolyl isomerase [Deinococcus radiophilus]UFA51810.1 peptidylprolyl isomerase [Deinococcus radiophilus]
MQKYATVVAGILSLGLASAGGLEPMEPRTQHAPVVVRETAWLTLDPENVLVIETSKGTVMVEMRPDLAPKAVERIKLLAREGVYDGLQFHRVIDLFVAQTGNPNNQDGGTSEHPNLEPEFSARLPSDADWVQVTNSVDANSGFLGSMPILTVSDAETRRRDVDNFQAWGAYCPGVAGMGRGEDIGSANSEIFFMRGASSFRLGLDYTAWGNTVIGEPVIRALTAGEPPANPDTMRQVRVLADIPADERPTVQILNPQSDEFQAVISQKRAERGADFSICDLTVPARVVD